MKTISRHSTKYDGSLHYRYPGTAVQEDTALLMLYCQPGIVCESYRGPLTASYHSLELYWSDRFYNLTEMWHPDCRPRMHYVNIATPATWDDGTLRFIDMDLDVIWRAESGEVILDDEDEFELHQVRFGYPSDLIAQVQRSAEEVREMIAQSAYPFDGSLFAWRPNGSPK
jgi:protein associated with RNAse G/E